VSWISFGGGNKVSRLEWEKSRGSYSPLGFFFLPLAFRCVRGYSCFIRNTRGNIMDVNEARQTLAREIARTAYELSVDRVMSHYDLLSEEDWDSITDKLQDLLPVPPHPVRTETAYRLLAERNA
jgi:hypothetical protein